MFEEQKLRKSRNCEVQANFSGKLGMGVEQFGNMDRVGCRHSNSIFCVVCGIVWNLDKIVLSCGIFIKSFLLVYLMNSVREHVVQEAEKSIVQYSRSSVCSYIS